MLNPSHGSNTAASFDFAIHIPVPGNGPARKKWVRHVSAAYRQRSLLIIFMWIAVIVVALALYWQYLRDSMPLLVAIPMSILTLAIGLLYDDEHRNLVNEGLAFVCGIVVCGLFQLVSNRKVLTTCECRMCSSELLVGKLLGAGNFGSVYKCKTSRRSALFGSGLHCVLKRIRVNLDTDINDASEALQEAKSLLQLACVVFCVRASMLLNLRTIAHTSHLLSCAVLYDILIRIFSVISRSCVHVPSLPPSSHVTEICPCVTLVCIWGCLLFFFSTPTHRNIHGRVASSTQSRRYIANAYDRGVSSHGVLPRR